nr:malonic semialdehyde reductase [Herbidospora cretacea]
MSAISTERVLDATAQDLLFREARTANTFTDEPVSDETAHAIYDLIKWGPTAMNNQPLRIVYVRSPEARARLVEHMSPGNKAKTSTAPLVAILAVDIDFHENLPKTFPHFPGAKDAFADRNDRVASARLNGGLQVGYFIVGVRAHGLAAGPMAGFDKDALEKEFFPGGNHEVLAVVNIGKPGPDAWYARNPRLDLHEAVTTV